MISPSGARKDAPLLNDAHGQAAIAVRQALADGNGDLAFAHVAGLDLAHRIEVLLGAAIRDRRDDFAAVRAWYAGDLRAMCVLLAVPPDTALDDAAVGLIVAGRVEERWRPHGSPVGDGRGAWAGVAAAVADGVGGLALVACLRDRLIHRAVLQYYVEGTIHALGVRPLLILAASPPGFGVIEGER
ncbi:MAG: hypothetical protein EXR69_01670 [Myxococcales bacterium]|nr:hypothetical protein [Myxococcales bacterium]